LNKIRIKNESNGIELNVWTNQNGFQFYTGNFLNINKNFNEYTIHDGFAIEAHNYPDSVNHVIFLKLIKIIKYVYIYILL
jgi:galactose mutarotase-like enzyme